MEDKTKQRMKLEGVPGAVPDVTRSHLPPTVDEFEQEDERDPDPAKRWVPIILVIGLLGVLGYWYATNQAPPKKKEIPPVPITVAFAETKTMPVEIRTIGNVTPVNTVEIKSRVEGHITQVHFKEGQDVHKGQLLFTIDPRQMQASLAEMAANVAKMAAGVKQAEANLKRDKALLQQAVANKTKDAAQQRMWAKQISRYAYLQKQGAVSEEQVDQTRANADAADATISADEASIENFKANIASDEANLANAKAQLDSAKAQMENARLNLEFTSIRSPIDGRTGSLMAFQGNLVEPEGEPLVTINQMKPIHVTFGVPEQALSELHKFSHRGALTVLAFPPGAKEGIPGHLTFSENAVDTTTGTIRLKATYPNLDNALWPGQFVDVVLRLSEEANALVVPQHAVQSGQQGHFVYVVRPDKTVEYRLVKVDRTIGDLSVITEGVKSGDEVVTDGHLQLTDGAKVLVKTK